jgi:tRNA(fMet)-specific endonuclease VapC
VTYLLDTNACIALINDSPKQVRLQLEAGGTPIGAYDLLVAGQARRHGATLVTANTSELARVDGLRWEDWASPG